MKKLYIVIAIAFLSGCGDFLEENSKGQVIGESALSNQEGLEAALVGAYKGSTRTWSRGFFNSNLQGFAMGADDLTTAYTKTQFIQNDIFEVSADNRNTDFIWKGCYKTIQGANNVIDNFRKVTVGDLTRINAIGGEAYFLRALSYFWLVRGWGDIPLVTTVQFNEDLLTIRKSPQREIYALIESDLAMAEELLANTKKDPGRPNKGSAKALLAEVYLAQGGWPINNTEKYALAASKAKEVIDNKATYNFDLVDLNILWSGALNSSGTKEEVFAFHASESVEGNTNASKGAAATPGEVGGWDDYFSEINFFKNFPEGKRKDKTFYTVFEKTNSDGSVTLIPWEQSTHKHPYYLKNMEAVGRNTYQTSLPSHMIRYAHVLLTYGEAQARSGGATPEAYAALNAVRERAGLPEVSGLGTQEFIKAVVDERGWEFAGEGTTRWFDLVRLEMVEAANANKDPNELPVTGIITKEDYLYPIPLKDASINPNLNGE